MSSNIRIEKTCLFCGALFIAKTTVTKYCSDTCAKKAYKQRKRQERLQETDIEDSTTPTRVIEQKEFLSIADACTLLGASRWTIYRMIENKRLTAVKFGRRTILRKQDINKLFD